MTGTVKSELRKFFSTRMWWGMAIAVFVIAAAFSAILTFASSSFGTDVLAKPAMVRSVYTGGLGMSYLLTLTIGVLMIGAEYRHKTMTATLLATPRRHAVMAAKMIALLAIGAFYGLISLVGSVGVGGALIASKGFSPFPDMSVWRTLALALLVLGLWALIGLGMGILIPNQVAALLVAISVAWIIEPLASALLFLSGWDWAKAIVPYFPSQATNAMVQPMTQVGQPSFPSLTWWGGALVLTAYALVFAGLGTLLTSRRDVS